eukprot:CAMPEP_0202481252 /NCGR_PEP_ID=MMETSP1361-20130828/909_1 /ASSEMBLY_ACC=CAM_ASM_000849 /TAXON_ID=210615 /ORGANISM="Staurosira complex sp., Strain CCMP2646" /LENGTH=121 /DNA_ID=CAMNT_0049108751 /DNA_START=193 /DNA_END=558 /DNA_ORIENTATION=-
MGCMQIKEATTAEEEDQILGPPSKVMDASEHVQHLVYMVKPALEMTLLTQSLQTLKAMQMISRDIAGNQGTMYYVKVKTSNAKMPWLFCKIYEPPTVTGVSPVQLKNVKQVSESEPLATFY